LVPRFAIVITDKPKRLGVSVFKFSGSAWCTDSSTEFIVEDTPLDWIESLGHKIFTTRALRPNNYSAHADEPDFVIETMTANMAANRGHTY
jgi:hypothetical protein